MTAHASPGLRTELPFAAMLRATDRDRPRVQLMASMSDNILQLPVQTRHTAESDGARQ